MFLTTASLLLCVPAWVPWFQGAPVPPRPGPWAVLGPFDAPGGAVSADAGLEKTLKRMKVGEPWPALEASFPGRGKTRMSWRWLSEEEAPRPASGGPFDTGTLDLHALTGAKGKDGENALAYLYRQVVADEAQEVQLTCGSDDSLRLWLNGELLIERALQRGLDPFADSLVLKLQPGINHLLVKVANGGGPWAFSMQAPPPPAGPNEINRAIQRGREWLLARQQLDGSWRERQEDYPSGMTALVLYTLLKSGLSPRHNALLQAATQLEAQPATRTYSLACQAFAIAALRDPVHREWLGRMARQLLDWQRSDGGWSYPGEQTDLSNTQYAALGLRAISHAGVEVPSSVWVEVAEYALQHQESRRRNEVEAGFIYIPGHGTGYTGSMTTAGLCALSLSREMLGTRMSPQLASQVEDALGAGQAWLASHWTVTSNPNKADWHLYYLYGLERVGSLLKLERLGGHDWYSEGASYLVRNQEGSGAWRGTEVETCFALLFLARATAKPLSEEDDPELLATPAPPPGERGLRLRARPGTPATLWIDRPHLAPDERLQEVEFFVRAPGEEWAEIGAGTELATRYHFEHPGSWELHAEALLVDGSRLLSPVLTLTHVEGLDPLRAAYASDALRNLIPAGRPSVRASSAAEPADRAADGHVWTRWLCDPKDADPWLQIDLAKQQVAGRLLLSHARATVAESAYANPRPVRVELWLDREKEPRLIEGDPDPRIKTVVPIDPPQKIARIKLRLVELTGGQLGQAAAGFGEVELQAPALALGK